MVCDFDRYIIRTNFNGTVQETHEFTNANIDDPKILQLLRAVFSNPEFLKPQRTTDEVTEKLAQQIGEVARLLQKRESVELIDARSRRELAVAQRKNLRIARFLNRIVFCFFAEDTGLLPKNVVTDIFKTGVDDPVHFAEVLEDLFRTMAKGGRSADTTSVMRDVRARNSEVNGMRQALVSAVCRMPARPNSQDGCVTCSSRARWSCRRLR